MRNKDSRRAQSSKIPSPITMVWEKGSSHRSITEAALIRRIFHHLEALAPPSVTVHS